MRRYRRIGRCNYHLCRIRTRLFRCKYCGNYYCKEHLNPKTPVSFGGVFRGKKRSIESLEAEREWRKVGHPCVPYGEWKRQKEKEDLEKRWKILDQFKEIKEIPSLPVSTELPNNVKKIFRTPKKSNREKLQIPKAEILPNQILPKKNHRKLGFAILIIIGIVYLLMPKSISKDVPYVLNNPKKIIYLPSEYKGETNENFIGDPIKEMLKEGWKIEYLDIPTLSITSERVTVEITTNNLNQLSEKLNYWFKTLNWKLLTCTDGTFYNHCSSNKPYYCLNGTLIENVTVCGCPADEVVQGQSCISKYEINPKIVTLNYILNGNWNSFDFTVYGGMNNYLAGIDRSISYLEGEPTPTFKDFVIKNIDNQKQQEFLESLAEKIKTLTNNSDDQARIAISIVQNIPYDYGTLKDRYAYQVLFDNSGVCSEKSRLLIAILRELNYGTALIDYGNVQSSSFSIVNLGISHEAVGIKCLLQYSYKNTGYCFIETTTPSIITYSNGDYPSMICQIQAGSSTSSCTQKLPDQFTLTTISDGNSFDSITIEYKDAQEWDKLNTISQSSGGLLDPYNYSEWWSLAIKYGIENSSQLK